MTESFLERIIAATRADLAERQVCVPLDAQRARAALAAPPRDFAGALAPATGASARLIAEVKRASPSKGVLTDAYDPVARARAYTAAGAAAISVLTEPHFFAGTLEHLSAVRAAVAVPVLRKDFIVDAYQVYEARAAGADAVLLICALLDDGQLAALLALCASLGMAALVEAHDATETARAVASGAALIGANCRDLRTFAVAPATVAQLRSLVPADRAFIAESGIATPADAARARAWGADAILVGEALMRAHDPTVLARALASAGGGGTAALFAGRARPFVKLCGLRAPDDARIAVAAGADAFGLIFGPFRRQVSPVQAARIVGAARAAATGGAGATAGAGGRPTTERAPTAPAPLAVGVFVDTAQARILETAAQAGLDVVQLSGAEPPEVCSAIAQASGLPVIKAVRAAASAEFAALDAYTQAGAALLLEPAGSGGPGGTGTRGDWDLARQIATQWPVILAGGLSPANVASALACVGPRGVDVSSGTETDGSKDPAKLRAFVAAARGAGAMTPATR